MLNVKYLIAMGVINDAHLELVYTDARKGHFVHRNVGALPRAFFVDGYEVIPEREDRLRRLNDSNFDPSRSAILEFDPKLEVTALDANAKARVMGFEPDLLVVEAENPHQGLMVVSEIYYPKGWRAYIDGVETQIFKTNHLLRSIWVPSGHHKVEFRFEPATYFRAVAVSRYAALVVYVVFLAELARQVALRTGKQQAARFRGQMNSKKANSRELAGQG
ncbi:MAG: hypothetical protein AMJ46_14730 [Latescibacteria bacterium DG_63]|nr:MAG: hypothetical protein AMJ46_14730 [Latescibacteria bacterium DG_63]